MQTAFSMKKIRINELARELEVKAHEILELLPELGVSEKKTHSSSIDEDVAIKLRQHYGQDIPDYVHDPNADDSASESHEEAPGEDGHEPPAAGTAVLAPLAPPAPTLPPAAESVLVPKEEKPSGDESPRPMAPIRPPLAGRPIHPPVGAHAPARPEAPRATPAPPAPSVPHPAPPASGAAPAASAQPAAPRPGAFRTATAVPDGVRSRCAATAAAASDCARAAARAPRIAAPQRARSPVHAGGAAAPASGSAGCPSRGAAAA